MFLHKISFCNDRNKSKSHPSHFLKTQKSNKTKIRVQPNTFALKQLKVKQHQKIAQQIIDLSETNNIKYGTIKTIITNAQKQFPFITRNGINFLLKL